MPSRKMRPAIYLFYGLDVEIPPIWTPPELFIHLGGAIGYSFTFEVCNVMLHLTSCLHRPCQDPWRVGHVLNHSAHDPKPGV